MTREQFFTALAEALRARLAPRDADDVLADYEGFFDAKAAEGLADAQICAELGAPEAIALEMACGQSAEAAEDEPGEPYMPPFKWKPTLAASILIAYTVCSALVCPLMREWRPLWVMAAAMLLPLAVLMRGERARRGARDRRALFMHLLLFGMAATMFALPSAGLLLDTVTFGHAFSAGMSAANVLRWLYPAAALAIALIELRRADREGVDCRPVLLHAVAAITGIRTAEWALYSMSSVSVFWSNMRVGAVVYLAAVCIILLAPRAVRRVRGLE